MIFFVKSQFLYTFNPVQSSWGNYLSADNLLCRKVLCIISSHKLEKLSKDSSKAIEIMYAKI